LLPENPASRYQNCIDLAHAATRRMARLCTKIAFFYHFKIRHAVAAAAANCLILLVL